MKPFLAMLTALALTSGAGIAQATDYSTLAETPSPTLSASADGVAAYRARRFDEALALLAPLADAGDVRALRYVGLALTEDPAATPAALKNGVARLEEAARAGDYLALIRLEDLRRTGLAHAPALADIIAIEKARAGAGDPVTAWRLAGRVEAGEALAGDDASPWLAIAAAADISEFPSAGEAAFRLCERHALGEARDPASAKRWCEKAADSGHAGAAILLRRLASLN